MRVVHAADLHDSRLDALSRRAAGTSVFQVPGWLRAWWEVLGRGDLLVQVVEEGGEPVAVAPWFVEGGMAFPVGSGSADHLDVLGGVDEAAARLLIEDLIASIPGFLGLRMFQLPAGSPTVGALVTATEAAGWSAYEESAIGAPYLDLSEPDAASTAANKKSLRRHQRWFEREGDLSILHTGSPSDDDLTAFFEQHVRRRAATESPSRFARADQREFFHAVAAAGREEGWVRFTTVRWNGDPIAFHFGFVHDGSYLWYKPSFEIELARRSPGEVLLRNLILDASELGARRFDFGIGEEAFKERFASGIVRMVTIGCYPPGVAG